MLVCIVTLHRARNCGAYMQSRALAEKIKQLGHEVVYLSPSGMQKRHYANLLIKNLLGPVCRRSFSEFSLNLRFNYQLFRDQHQLRETKHTEHIDCFILGSDVIWQLRSDLIYRHMDRYFGLSFPENKVFSYAPSANGAAPELFNDERISLALKRMRDISVRDESTRQIISAHTDRPVSLVCDPVMLHDPDFYRTIQRPCPHRDFILVYAFGHKDFTESRIREIQSYAKANGKKLISFGINRKWCDLSVPYDSLAMSAYYDHADCVITNTFHGTVFSILYGKRFAELTPGKNKVNDLLAQFGLENRIPTPDGSIASILDREIDQDDLKKRVEALRAASIDYLKRNLY